MRRSREKDARGTPCPHGGGTPAPLWGCTGLSSLPSAGDLGKAASGLLQRLAFGQSPKERAAEVAPPAALGSAPGCPQTLLTPRDRGTRGHTMKGPCLPLRCPLWLYVAWPGGMEGAEPAPSPLVRCLQLGPTSAETSLRAPGPSWWLRSPGVQGREVPDGGTCAHQGWKELRATWWL